MRQVVRGLAVGVVSTVLAVPIASADYKHLKVNLRVQQDKCWCGIAAMQMWASWLKGGSYTESNSQQWRGQAYLANKYNVGSFQSNFNPNGDQKWACVRNNRNVGGTSLSKMIRGLEDHSPSQYNFANLSYTNKDDMIGYIAKNIAWDKPIIVMGNTVYTDGREEDVREGGHYILFDAVVSSYWYDIASLKSGSNRTIARKVSGFYVNDPAADTRYNYIKSYYPTRKVSKNEVKNNFLGKVGGRYQFIKSNM